MPNTRQDRLLQAAGGDPKVAAQLQQGIDSGAYEYNKDGTLVSTSGPMKGVRIGQATPQQEWMPPTGADGKQTRAQQAANNRNVPFRGRDADIAMQKSSYLQDFKNDRSMPEDARKSMGKKYGWDAQEPQTASPAQQSPLNQQQGPGGKGGGSIPPQLQQAISQYMGPGGKGGGSIPPQLQQMIQQYAGPGGKGGAQRAPTPQTSAADPNLSRAQQVAQQLRGGPAQTEPIQPVTAPAQPLTQSAGPGGKGGGRQPPQPSRGGKGGQAQIPQNYSTGALGT